VDAANRLRDAVDATEGDLVASPVPRVRGLADLA